MVSGPVRSNQGVLSGRHSLDNSPPNPRPCPAFLGSPAPPAGLVHNHPNQPQLRLNLSQCPVFLGSPTPPAGLGNSHPNQPQLQPKTGTGLSVPYNQNLQRGIYDKMMITIMGRVKPNAKQFTVNFLRGKDIAFHLNSRFNEGGKQAVVRNTKVGEHWGKEERHTQGGFPFMAGQSFEMKILVTSGEFKVAVNGAQLFEFKHRVRELNQIDRINILYDVILISINVDTIP
ncbi:galectin-5-like [Salvelinus namaycush]|uniref:Galectin n=1 Tax=Salvelinus namaycush TaxID=8040 RepID=A0A8U0TQH2_SALNM|nr:galectin-5-like [Salvelinus namaycush]